MGRSSARTCLHMWRVFNQDYSKRHHQSAVQGSRGNSFRLLYTWLYFYVKTSAIKSGYFPYDSGTKNGWLLPGKRVHIWKGDKEKYEKCVYDQRLEPSS